jgi:rhamnogalacturonan II specific xylosyltransferase
VREHDRLSQFLERVAVDKTVILGQTSCAFLEFAENWALHLVDLRITNWLLIANDDASYHYLDRKYPGHIIPISVFSPDAKMATGGLLEYASQAFNMLMCERLAFQEAVLVRGYWLLWCDTDIAWRQNVLDLIPPGFDWVGVDDERTPITSPSKDTTNVCGCLMFWAPTPEAKRVMNTWHQKCIATKGSSQDQEMFGIWWNDGDLKQILRWYILPHHLYASGGTLTDHFDTGLFGNSRAMLPAMVHANYRIGSAQKREFLEERHAWKVPKDELYPSCSAVTA